MGGDRGLVPAPPPCTMAAEVEGGPMAPIPMVGVSRLLHSGKKEHKLPAEVGSTPLFKLVPLMGSSPRLEPEAGGHHQRLSSPLLPRGGRGGGHPRGSGTSAIYSTINYCILINSDDFQRPSCYNERRALLIAASFSQL